MLDKYTYFNLKLIECDDYYYLDMYLFNEPTLQLLLNCYSILDALNVRKKIIVRNN